MVGAQVRLHRKLKRWQRKSPTPLTIFNLNYMPQFNNFYLNLNFLNSGIASLCWLLKNKSQLLKHLKCKVPFLLLIILPFFANSQNLVPNWSFEEYDDCPTNIGQIQNAIGWMSFRLSPDYFNACNDEYVGVPENYISQVGFPIDGQAYSGIVRNHNTGNSEVLAIQLLDSLTVGLEYYVSFYLKRSLFIGDCWNNNMGANFTTEVFSDWPFSATMPIYNSAHILYSGMFDASNVWVKVEDTFIADSSYKYIAIGYHFDDENLLIECANNEIDRRTYFFVDCVCVAVDPDMCPVCETTTEINTLQTLSKDLIAFPNPFIDNCQIILPANIKGSLNLQLYNSSGVLVKQWVEVAKEIIVITEGILKDKGLYILEVGFESGEKSHIKLLKM